MMKKFIALLLSLMMVLSLAACGNSASTAQTSAAEPESADSGSSPSLWDLARAETPDLSDTVWNLVGGYAAGKEMTQEQLDAALNQYGGALAFAFDAENGAQMIQGVGTVSGTYEYLEDGSVSVVLDNNGSELCYTCIFSEISGTFALIAIADDSGLNGIYLVQ